MKVTIEQETNMRVRDGELDVDNITRVEYETGNESMVADEAHKLVDLINEYGGNK